MPDPKKLEGFKKDRVRLVQTCATCEAGRFDSRGASWGYCEISEYVHEKQGRKPLPAHVLFTCPRWEKASDIQVRRELGLYADLVDS